MEKHLPANIQAKQPSLCRGGFQSMLILSGVSQQAFALLLSVVVFAPSVLILNPKSTLYTK